MSFTRQDSIEDLAVLPQDCVRRAVLIATGRYSDDTIPKLPGVRHDVNLISEILLDPRCGFKEVGVLNTDDREAGFPIKKNITKTLDKYLKKCGVNDFLFLYFAGHGFYDSKNDVDYYVPFDAENTARSMNDVSFSSADCFSLKSLRERLGACKAKYKWVVVDACRVKLNRDRFGIPYQEEQRANREIKDAGDSLWFQSCGIDQRSYEFPVEENGRITDHGLFTWYFYQGAMGAAADRYGRISPKSLFDYTSERMVDYCRKEAVLPQIPLTSPNSSDYQFVFIGSNSKSLYREAGDLLLDAQYEQALAKINEALRLEPNNEKYKVRKAQIETFIPLEKRTTDAPQIPPETSPVDDRESKDKESRVELASKIAYQKACKLFLDGKDEQALEKITEAVKIDSENKEYQNLLNRIKDVIRSKRGAQANIPPQVTHKKELPVSYSDSKGKEYRLIKAGSFWMGEQVAQYMTPDDPQWYNGSRCYVTLTKDFYLAKRLVTREEFQRFVEDTGYETTAEKEGSAWTVSKSRRWEFAKGKCWRDPGFEQTNEHPVVCVSYYDAIEYISWLNKTSTFDELSGFKPEYRLPTEAEWEYACRAGTTTEFFWGDKEKEGKGYLNAAGKDKGPNEIKWDHSFPFDTGYPATSPVGSFLPNNWDLYDMIGNVWEWTSDWYGDYPREAVTDPKGADNGSRHVLRGGGWNCRPACCRCAYRRYGGPTRRSALYGFRVAFSLTPK